MKYHGNMSTGKKLWDMKVGDTIEVSPDEFPKYANARAYIQRKTAGTDDPYRITSQGIKKGGKIVFHIFKRISVDKFPEKR